MMDNEDYFLPQSIIQRLQEKLQDRAKPSYKAWFTRYLKNAALVRGVPMQEIRFTVSKWNMEWQLEQQSVPMELQISVALLLLQSNFIEDQLASIVFLDEVLIPNAVITHASLPLFEQLFAAGNISNFKVCDHFSSKVLQPLILRHGSVVTKTLARWFDAPSVWQARSALKSFVPFANDAIYEDVILMGCNKLVRRTEEDAKSMVASALKALGKRNFQTVEGFFAKDIHLACIKASGLTKACEPLPTGDEKARELRVRRRLLLEQGVAAQAEMEMQQHLAMIQTSGYEIGVTGQAGRSRYHIEQSTQAGQEQLMKEASASCQDKIDIFDKNLETADEDSDKGIVERIE